MRLAVVLGLGEQIRRDQARFGAAVGDDQHLRRAGDRVDVDLAEDQALGRGDPLVAGPDDLVDPRHRRGAVGQRRDRLGAAELEHAIDAGQLRRQQRLGRRAGVTITISRTPATRAGIAVISTDDG